MASCAKNAIFTNTALTDDGDLWWEGIPSQTACLLMLRDHLVAVGDAAVDAHLAVQAGAIDDRSTGYPTKRCGALALNTSQRKELSAARTLLIRSLSAAAPTAPMTASSPTT